MVEDALLNRYAQLYTLWAYVVMANHVHILKSVLRPRTNRIQTEVCATTGDETHTD
jgi:REP element-mobilizing transposase RayT